MTGRNSRSTSQIRPSPPHPHRAYSEGSGACDECMRLLRKLLAASTPPAPPSAPAFIPCPLRPDPRMIGRSATVGGRKGSMQRCADRCRLHPAEPGCFGRRVSVLLNPDMLNGRPEIVRTFVFKHECGHLTVGGSELAADCFAVHQGVRERGSTARALTKCARLLTENPSPIPTPPPNADAETSISVTSKRWRSSVPAIRSSRAVVEPPGKSSLPKKTLANKPAAAKAWRRSRHRRHPLLPNRPSWHRHRSKNRRTQPQKPGVYTSARRQQRPPIGPCGRGAVPSPYGSATIVATRCSSHRRGRQDGRWLPLDAGAFSFPYDDTSEEGSS